MMKRFPKAEFGKLLQTRRKYMQLTQASLAKQIAVSPILISYYERGHRTPRYETAQKIANVLRLEGEEREQFLASLKFPAESSPDINDLLDELLRLFSNRTISPALKDKLASEIHNVLKDWREMQKKNVCWAVVPVAGWQARLLSPDATAHMTERVISEAENAGIDHIVVVVAPSQEHALSEKLMDSKRHVRIRLAVQTDQFGLGDAILAARHSLPHNEPFAVILPDDDLDASCLEPMIEAYSKDKCCILAVREIQESDEGSYGIVSIQEQQGPMCRIEDLQEKPSTLSGSSFAIVGRYIVTPDIFKAIEVTRPTASGEIELTDAIRNMSQNQPIYGYIYTGVVDSLSPSRRLLERMIMSRGERLAEPTI
ncbi:sugar phosphate nucleotidyltransferase [Candidatus Entotheonella palauensis]|uniref:sugar phosphate nucleotidyltransferase n=1 Tax=Candidatus Entotheonella palauensis TaxID=93172 RepID=UPI000B7DD5E0|nr:sugar phosphate nucleotidyltransferase [Candidatus Entotheonella palauensis]